MWRSDTPIWPKCITTCDSQVCTSHANKADRWPFRLVSGEKQICSQPVASSARSNLMCIHPNFWITNQIHLFLFFLKWTLVAVKFCFALCEHSMKCTLPCAVRASVWPSLTSCYLCVLLWMLLTGSNSFPSLSLYRNLHFPLAVLFRTYRNFYWALFLMIRILFTLF